jgi:uncharacterized protein
MNFVTNLSGLSVDDQYFMEVPVPQGSATVPTGNIGLVGSFSRGPIGQWVLCTSYPDLVKKFGEVDSAFTLTGTVAARNIFAQGNVNLYVARVQNSTTPGANATAILNDNEATPKAIYTLNAATPGTWGNSLVGKVTAGTIANTLKVSLSYGNETETFDNLVPGPGSAVVGAQTFATVFGTATSPGLSKLAYGTAPATENDTLPTASSFPITLTFAGGSNGAVPLAADYVGSSATTPKTGLGVLDSAPINYILAAEQTDPTVNAGLLANVNTITNTGGLPRKAIVQFSRATAPSGVAALLTALDSDRIIPAYLFQLIYDPISGANQIVAPGSFMAGVLAQLQPHQSPGNKQIVGTIGYDPNLNIGPSELKTLADAHCNVVGVTTPAGYIVIRCGFTGSSQAGDLQQIYVRNMKDFIDQSVFQMSGSFVDMPITPDLMRKVAQTVDNVLFPLKSPSSASNQMIADYMIQCDSNNNTAESLSANQLICDYAVKLLNINRFMVFRVQIGSGVVTSSQTN